MSQQQSSPVTGHAINSVKRNHSDKDNIHQIEWRPVISTLSPGKTEIAFCLIFSFIFNFIYFYFVKVQSRYLSMEVNLSVYNSL